ncbi:MAG: D-xylose transporter XylE [Hyphomicrobiales bacterium]
MNDSRTFKRRTFRLTLVATLGGLLFGYDTAVVSGTVGSLQHYFIAPLHLSVDSGSSLLGFAVSSALIGCIIGSLLSGIVNNRLGRRRTMLLSAILFLISAIGSAMPEIFFAKIGDASGSFLPNFIVYRIIGGLGVGLASMTSPAYIAEIVPSRVRGKLVALNQFAIIFGILVSYFVNYFIASLGDLAWINSIGWRWMFAVEGVPAILFFILLFFVPESPYWHIQKGFTKKALKTLYSLSPPERAKEHVTEINKSMHHTTSKLLSYGWYVIIIGVIINIAQQLSGINIVLYYAPVIFGNLGDSVQSSLLATAVLGVVNLLFTVVSMYTVDKFGRRVLLIIGSAIMCVSLVVLGLAFSFKSMGFLPLSMLFLYIIGFAISWGPVAWVLNSELFPSKIRNKALSVVIAIQWVFNYLVSSTFPFLNENEYLVRHFNHGFSFWIYGFFTFLALLFAIFMLPETRRKSLEEIEAIWLKRKKK